MTGMATFPEVLPKFGILYQETTPGLALCKPKLLPMKSMTLEKLEVMQKQAQETLKEQDAQEKEEERQAFQQGMSDLVHRASNPQSTSTSWQLNRGKETRFDAPASSQSQPSGSSKPDILSNNQE